MSDTYEDRCVSCGYIYTVVISDFDFSPRWECPKCGRDN